MTEPLSQPVPPSARARTAQPVEDLHGAGSFPYSNAGADTGSEPDRASPPSTPRWVKAFGIITIVLALLFVGLHLTGNVPTHTPPSSGTEYGMQAP